MTGTDEAEAAATATDEALYVLTAALLTPAQFPSVLGDDYPEACAALGLGPYAQGYGLVLGQDGSGARWTVVIDDVSLVAVAIASWDCGMEYELSPDDRTVVAALPGWPLELAVSAPGRPRPARPRTRSVGSAHAHAARHERVGPGPAPSGRGRDRACSGRRGASSWDTTTFGPAPDDGRLRVRPDRGGRRRVRGLSPIGSRRGERGRPRRPRRTPGRLPQRPRREGGVPRDAGRSRGAGPPRGPGTITSAERRATRKRGRWPPRRRAPAPRRPAFGRRPGPSRAARLPRSRAAGRPRAVRVRAGRRPYAAGRRPGLVPGRQDRRRRLRPPGRVPRTRPPGGPRRGPAPAPGIPGGDGGTPVVRAARPAGTGLPRVRSVTGVYVTPVRSRHSGPIECPT